MLQLVVFTPRMLHNEPVVSAVEKLLCITKQPGNKLADLDSTISHMAAITF